MDADVGWRPWSACSTGSDPTSGTCSTSRWSGFFSTRPAGSRGTGEGVQSLLNARCLAPCSCCTSPCTAGHGWALPPLAWRATCLFYLQPDQEVLLTLLSVASTRCAADTLYLWPDQEVLLKLLSVASTRCAADTHLWPVQGVLLTLICGQYKACCWHSYLWSAQGVLLTLLSVASTKRRAADTLICDQQRVCSWHF